MTQAPTGAARLELEVLGHSALRRNGDDVQPVLAQPKRFALLTYLVLRRPSGFVRRDELLHLFWGESGEARARASLRQALAFLRRHLGDDVIVSRGAGEVGLRREMIHCDAVEFTDALTVADDARAVAAYHGELLPAFLFEGDGAFEQWLSAERRYLQSAAVQAALRLAEEAEREGRNDVAHAHVEWALRLEPLDEIAASRLTALRARFGGDAGARPGAANAAPATASSQRVLVLPFENLTGDAGLNILGRLAADAIAASLAELRDLEVVPPLATFGGPAGAAASAETATRTGAGTLVTGTFYPEGEQLLFLPRITAIRENRLLAGPGATAVERGSPAQGIARLCDLVVRTVAPALSLRPVHVRPAARPPSLAAYTAYVDGQERFIRGEWRAALRHLERAAELEPDYALPRIVRAIVHWNLCELPQAKAAALEAERTSAAAGRFERGVLDMVRAWLDGDWAAAYRADVVQAELAPHSIPHFGIAEEARRLNRPREARAVLSALEPEVGELKGWIYYWVELATSWHMTGDHDRELETARRCGRLYPNDSTATLLEVRALAALGRTGELAPVLETALARPPGGNPGRGSLLLEAALELQAHGAAAPAEEWFQRAADWLDEQVLAGTAGEPQRREAAKAAYLAGRMEQARVAFTELAGAGAGGVRPVGLQHHPQLQAHLDQGYLAVIAVQQGDREAADFWCERLRQLDAPFLYGAQWYWLARVAALEGRKDEAVRLLGRSFAEGLSLEMFLHTDPHLARLRGHPAFELMLRPRG